ncbi:membrane protein insertase YidC [Bacteriovoracaceae bacterium]|nr:membrane protein insertase YidC [Bacteriovoracaceae bacterium]
MQMPILVAFYQVLYNAIELVGAPFILWIHDLSVKDPYYVLPVLMGISMFFQSKINPSPSADPTQKKVMMFMPLIFTFFMKDLPAGLNLYIFVSTLFGIVQQLFVYRIVK